MARIHFIVAIMLWVTAVVQCQVFIEVPINTAAHMGESVRLNCTFEWSEERFVEWTYENTRIYDSGTGVKDPSKYDVTTDGSGQFDLHVKNIQEDVSGFYTCGLPVEDEKTRVEVVALGPMACPDEGQTVDEGDLIMLHCGVTYYGYKIPTLTWAGEDMIPLEGKPGTGENSVMEYVNLTATAAEDEQTFTCHLTFEAAESDDADPPEFTDMCHTHFLVNHGVTDLQFEPDPDNFVGQIIELYVGEHINCTASGRPEPDYTWLDENDEEIDQDFQLDITWDMLGQHTVKCHAENMFEGEQKVATRDVTFRAEEPPASSATHIAVIMPFTTVAYLLTVLF